MLLKLESQLIIGNAPVIDIRMVRYDLVFAVFKLVSESYRLNSPLVKWSL